MVWNEPRWPYYLGDNFYNQGRFQEREEDQHKAKEEVARGEAA